MSLVSVALFLPHIVFSCVTEASDVAVHENALAAIRIRGVGTSTKFSPFFPAW